MPTLPNWRVVAVLACLACLTAPAPLAAQTIPCDETRPDSLASVQPAVHRACDVTQPAVRSGKDPALDFRPTDYAAADQAGCMSAKFGFVVDARGRVEAGSILLLFSLHPEFAAAVQATLERLRFEPARLEGTPVRQWVAYERRAEPRRPGRVPFAVGRVVAGPVPPGAGRVNMPIEPSPLRPPPRMDLDPC